MARDAALWRTPTSTDWKGESAQRWKERERGDNTPRLAESSGERVSRGVADTLTAASRKWPTPTAGDGKASGSRNTPTSTAHAGVSLTDAALTGNSAGRRDETTPQAGSDGSPLAVLHPQFVETLMGFDPGWTDCGAWETPWCPSKPSTPSASSSLEHPAPLSGR